jgi:hypothetical protein
MRQVHIEFCSPLLFRSNVYDSVTGEQVQRISKIELAITAADVHGTARIYYTDGIMEDVMWWPLRVIDREGKPVSGTKRMVVNPKRVKEREHG